jgi:hypothetical protein
MSAQPKQREYGARNAPGMKISWKYPENGQQQKLRPNESPLASAARFKGELLSDQSVVGAPFLGLPSSSPSQFQSPLTFAP